MDNGKVIEYFDGRNWIDVPVELKRRVVDNIPSWADRSRQDALFMWHNTVGHYNSWLKRRLPTLMQLLDSREGNFRFKNELMSDRTFCFMSGIPYEKADECLDYVRAVVAEIYWEDRCWVL